VNPFRIRLQSQNVKSHIDEAVTPVNEKMEEMMDSFFNKAVELGADAVINLKFENGSYQQNGSGWVVSYLMIYGEAVLTKPTN